MLFLCWGWKDQPDCGSSTSGKYIYACCESASNTMQYFLQAEFWLIGSKLMMVAFVSKHGGGTMVGREVENPWELLFWLDWKEEMSWQLAGNLLGLLLHSFPFSSRFPYRTRVFSQ